MESSNDKSVSDAMRQLDDKNREDVTNTAIDNSCCLQRDTTNHGTCSNFRESSEAALNFRRHDGEVSIDDKLRTSESGISVNNKLSWQSGDSSHTALRRCFKDISTFKEYKPKGTEKRMEHELLKENPHKSKVPLINSRTESPYFSVFDHRKFSEILNNSLENPITTENKDRYKQNFKDIEMRNITSSLPRSYQFAAPDDYDYVPDCTSQGFNVCTDVQEEEMVSSCLQEEDSIMEHESVELIDPEPSATNIHNQSIQSVIAWEQGNGEAAVDSIRTDSRAKDGIPGTMILDMALENSEQSDISSKRELSCELKASAFMTYNTISNSDSENADKQSKRDFIGTPSSSEDSEDSDDNFDIVEMNNRRPSTETQALNESLNEESEVLEEEIDRKRDSPPSRVETLDLNAEHASKEHEIELIDLEDEDDQKEEINLRSKRKPETNRAPKKQVRSSQGLSIEQVSFCRNFFGILEKASQAGGLTQAEVVNALIKYKTSTIPKPALTHAAKNFLQKVVTLGLLKKRNNKYMVACRLKFSKQEKRKECRDAKTHTLSSARNLRIKTMSSVQPQTRKSARSNYSRLHSRVKMASPTYKSRASNRRAIIQRAYGSSFESSNARSRSVPKTKYSQSTKAKVILNPSPPPQLTMPKNSNKNDINCMKLSNDHNSFEFKKPEMKQQLSKITNDQIKKPVQLKSKEFTKPPFIRATTRRRITVQK